MQRRRKADAGSRGGPLLGLDIGATSVRAAALSVTSSPTDPDVAVHALGQVELPPGAVVNGVVADSDAVTAAVKKLWSANKFRTRDVVLATTNLQVAVRTIDLPRMPPDQIAKALPFQAREVIALPLDQAVLDFTPLEPENTDSEFVRGLLVAAPRAPITAAVNAVERAGLRVSKVDLGSFAIVRSIADDDVAVEAVVDLGAHLTTVVVHTNGIPAVVRTVGRGSDELTARLAAHLDLDLAAAEHVKRTVGVGDQDPAVAAVLREAIRGILTEIRSSLQLFTSSNPGLPVQRLLLTGGGAFLPGLPDLMSERLGLSTSVINPLRHARPWDVRTGLAEVSASAVSVGLALGAAA